MARHVGHNLFCYPIDSFRFILGDQFDESLYVTWPYRHDLYPVNGYSYLREFFQTLQNISNLACAPFLRCIAGSV